MSTTTTPTAGGGCRTPDAVLAEAVAQLHAALDVIASVDPAELTGYGLGDQVAGMMTARRRVEGAVGVFGHRFAGTDEWADYRKRRALAGRPGVGLPRLDPRAVAPLGVRHRHVAGGGSGVAHR